ncbi:putative reverse transcriptase domain-containing protein, partial [Tanacetum coccineum]
PRNEVKQIENELWNLKVKGTNLIAYNQRFQELILLCPEMVPNADQLLERYIEGLPLNIKGNVTSSKPVDLHEAIDMAQGLMYQVVQELGENSGDKRKWNKNHYTHNPNNTNNTSNLNPNKRPKTAKVFSAGQGSYAGKLPHYGKCGRHHTDACPPACYNCGKAGHKAKDYRAPPRPANQRGPGSQGGQGSDVTCFRCGEKGYYKNKCPNNGNQGGGNQIRVNQPNPQNNQRQNQGNPKGSSQASTSTQGGRKVYSLCAEAAVKNNNVVNGTFLINNVYALVLFDTGADRSFVSYAFSKYIDIHPTTLDTNYSVELADGKSLTINTILRGCTLNLQNHLFKIDLLPIELGSFDVIVEMDWMAKHRAEVVCYEKYIRVPYGNDMLIIQGERSGVKNESILEVISSIRTQKYIDQGCQVFLIQIMKEEETKIPERRIEDVPVVRDFPEVFPEELPRLPPIRHPSGISQRADTRACTCCKLHPIAMHLQIEELAEQLKELSDKVKFLGHVIDSSGIHVDHPTKIKAVQGNSPKRLGKDAKGNTIVHPPVSLDEHVAVQRENKVRTLLLQALPEDHMPDFHHYERMQGMICIQLRLASKTGEKCAQTHSTFHWNKKVSGSKPTYSDQQHMFTNQFLSDIWFEKKAGRKMNYNNQQPARFDRRKKLNRQTKSLWSPLIHGGTWSDPSRLEKQTDLVRLRRYMGMMARLPCDNGCAGSKGKRKNGNVKYEATLARFEKWKESSKNLNKLINSSMSTRTKVGLGFKEYFGENEVFDLSRPSTRVPKPMLSRRESNDFVSCDNSDKSSDSETHTSCDSSLKTKTKDFPPAVDIQTLPESD